MTDLHPERKATTISQIRNYTTLIIIEKAVPNSDTHAIFITFL